MSFFALPAEVEDRHKSDFLEMSEAIVNYPLRLNLSFT